MLFLDFTLSGRCEMVRRSTQAKNTECCPWCGYCLKGLPRKYKCPECGFRYDRGAVVVECPRRLWALLTVLSMITFAIGVYIWMQSGQFTLFLSTCTLILVGLIRYTRGRRLVHVSEDELRIIRRGATEELYPIKEIGAAHWSGVTGDITVWGRDGEPIVIIHRGFLDSHRLAKRVVSAIERATQVDRADGVSHAGGEVREVGVID